MPPDHRPARETWPLEDEEESDRSLEAQEGSQLPQPLQPHPEAQKDAEVEI